MSDVLAQSAELQVGGVTCGALAPDFALRDVARPADAAPFRLRSLRQRRPTLLALLPGGTAPTRNETWLRALAEQAGELALYEVAPLAIAPTAEAQRLLATVDVAYPILADEDGATLAAYLGVSAQQPALALVDRYSRLVTIIPAHGLEQAPDMAAALREIRYADQGDCACALPAWATWE